MWGKVQVKKATPKSKTVLVRTIKMNELKRIAILLPKSMQK